MPQPQPQPREPRSDREAKLLHIGTSLSAASENHLRASLVSIMLQVPEWSATSDRAYLGYLYRFADWVTRTEGWFDVNHHMDDRRIAAWVEQDLSDRRETSRQTAYLAIRRIRDHKPTEKRQTVRNRVAAPHTEAEWVRYSNTASSLGRDDLGRDVQMLLDLTGEAGLRAEEAIRLDGLAVDVTAGRTSILVANRDGVARQVPLFGLAAARLSVHAGSDQYLLRPGMLKARHNVVNEIVTDACRRANAMTGFKATRARSRFLVHLFQQPVPFTVVAAVADLNPGSHTPSDLLHYAIRVSPAEVEQALRAAHGDGSAA